MSVLPATVACVAVCVAVGLTGCADAGGVTQPPIQPPPDSVRFAAVVQPMFTQNCAFANCHAGATPQEGMNLSVGQAYGNTVNVAASQVPDWA